MTLTEKMKERLETTEALSGKNSERYLLQSQLLYAADFLENSDVHETLILKKECKGEVITVEFKPSDFLFGQKDVKKIYYDKEMTTVRKVKRIPIPKTIENAVTHCIYDLIINGYQIVK